MSTLKTQYKNWILKNPNSQLTYLEWFLQFNEIHNLPSDMSDWNVTLMDVLENEVYISDDFQIRPDKDYEYNNNMTPKEKADKLVDVFYQTTPNEALINEPIELSLEYKAWQQAKQCALICCNEVLGNMGADRGYMFWLEVKQEVEKL